MIANLVGSDGLIVVVVALVVLVGGSQLPKIARNVGLAGKEFRKAQQESEEEAARARSAKAQQEAVVPLPAAPVVAPVTPAVAQTQPAATAPAEPGITLTPAQLDALLKAREEQVRGEAN